MMAALDFLVLRGGWEFPLRPSLLNGTFTDVTVASGIGETLVASQTAVWADINNDGLLDLFLGNESGGNELFLNKGDGTFENISHAAGIDRPGQTKGVVAADYDHDGYADFYVTKIASITTIMTTRLPTLPRKRAFWAREEALPRGSSTTTTAVGQTFL
jgi:FG-GAP-like repeat